MESGRPCWLLLGAHNFGWTTDTDTLQHGPCWVCNMLSEVLSSKAARWHVQVYSEVLPLLPDVQYNAPARILTLRASGSRKQPRLPGDIRTLVCAVHAAKP